MRQDMREREREIRRLHESIEKYEQSPRTKKVVEQATINLMNAIQYKFRNSQINQKYTFPRLSTQRDEYDTQVQIINLKSQRQQLISHNLSIAEQAQSNQVYISEKTSLIQDKFSSPLSKQLQLSSPFTKQLSQHKSKLKIKVVKKNNFDTCQATHKLDRLRTEQIHFSTKNIKKQTETGSVRNHNQSNRIKSRILQQCTENTGIRKKLKIASKIDCNDEKSTKTSLTMKTQYTYSNKRKQGKQNLRIPLQCRQLTNIYQQHFISQNNMKKIIEPLVSASRAYLNIKCSVKKKKQIDVNVSFVQTQKGSKVNHKSSENLKSIRLGRTSTEKLKTVKLYA